MLTAHALASRARSRDLQNILAWTGSKIREKKRRKLGGGVFDSTKVIPRFARASVLLLHMLPSWKPAYFICGNFLVIDNVVSNITYYACNWNINLPTLLCAEQIAQTVQTNPAERKIRKIHMNETHRALALETLEKRTTWEKMYFCFL